MGLPVAFRKGQGGAHSASVHQHLEEGLEAFQAGEFITVYLGPMLEGQVDQRVK